MPIQIGTKTHSFSDPTGLLFDCHRRIEMFLTVLEAVATVIDRPTSEETRRALDSALHYFAEAAPNHTADEEVSLFPRLRQIQQAEVQSPLSQLEELEEEHRWAAALHVEVEGLGRKYLLTSCLSGTEVEKFRNSVTCLVFMYTRHIKIEDSVVFPLATRLLSDAEKMAIAEEMTRRRGVKLITEIEALKMRG